MSYLWLICLSAYCGICLSTILTAYPISCLSAYCASICKRLSLFLHSRIDPQMDHTTKFVVSRTGVRLLEFNGYVYRRNGASGNGSRQYFKCSRACPATIIMSNGKIVKVTGFHRDNHKPSNHVPTNHVPAEKGNEECSKKLGKFCELARKICPGKPG